MSRSNTIYGLYLHNLLAEIIIYFFIGNMDYLHNLLVEIVIYFFIGNWYMKSHSHMCILFQAPPRAEVVKSLKNGIVLNILGMGAAVLGMQATVWLLVAKALTSSAVPYYQGLPPGQSPVLALDVFLVQVYAHSYIIIFLLKLVFIFSCIWNIVILSYCLVASIFLCFTSQIFALIVLNLLLILKAHRE